jgi:hypothetical protein
MPITAQLQFHSTLMIRKIMCEHYIKTNCGEETVLGVAIMYVICGYKRAQNENEEVRCSNKGLQAEKKFYSYTTYNLCTIRKQ